MSIPKEWQSYQLPVDITCVLRIKYVYTLFLFCMLGNCMKTDKSQKLTNCSKFFISLHFFYSFGPSIIWMWSTREELWERKTQTIKVSTNVIFNWNIILSIIDRFIGYCQWKLNFNWFLFYFFRASAGVWLEGWCRQRRRDLLLHSLSDKPSHWLMCNVLVILWQISCRHLLSSYSATECGEHTEIAACQVKFNHSKHSSWVFVRRTWAEQLMK